MAVSIQFTSEHIKNIKQDAEHAYPNEACGLITGRTIDSDALEVMRVVKAQNIRASETIKRFEVDPGTRIKLEKEKVVPYPLVLAALIRPAISLQQGKKDQAIIELKTAIQLAEENQLLFHLAGAKRRLGELLGKETEEGRALFQASEDYAQEEGIKEPEKMFEVVAPGFPKNEK